MKKLGFGVTLAALLMFTGCNDFSSPVAVVNTAYAAVKKGDLKLLGKALTSDAKKEFATEEGLAALQAKLNQQNITTGHIELTNVERDEHGDQRSREYQVEIMARPQANADGEFARVMEATIVCSVDYIRNYCTGDEIVQHGSDPNYIYMNCARWDAEREVREVTDCRISQLKM